MKVVILAGGLGTRISEETFLRPKPMIEIGGRPILWHLMKIYSSFEMNEFIICCGYKSHVIKEYFANYFLHNSDITIDVANNSLTIHREFSEPWKVTLVDTGAHSMTGGRLLRVKEYLDDEDFCFTYGDGLANVDIRKLVHFHRANGVKATLTAVQPPGRFGVLEMHGDKVHSFKEKPSGGGSLINGGFFVLSPEVLDHIEDDNTIWERGPLEALAASGELNAFLHEGFWHPMDTLRDKNYLEELWLSGAAPWKTWNA